MNIKVNFVKLHPEIFFHNQGKKKIIKLDTHIICLYQKKENKVNEWGVDVILVAPDDELNKMLLEPLVIRGSPIFVYLPSQSLAYVVYSCLTTKISSVTTAFDD